MIVTRWHPSHRTAASLIARLRAELAGAFIAAGTITLFINVGLLFVPIYDMILYDRLMQSKNMDTVTILTIGVVISMMIFGALEFCRFSILVVMADRLARRLNLPTLQAAMVKSLEGASSVAAQAMRDLTSYGFSSPAPPPSFPLT